MITKELILSLLYEELNGRRFFPTDYSGLRKVFLRQGILFQGYKYKLIF